MLDAVLTVVDAKHCMQHLDEVKPEGVVNEALQQVWRCGGLKQGRRVLVAAAWRRSSKGDLGGGVAAALCWCYAATNQPGSCTNNRMDDPGMPPTGGHGQAGPAELHGCCLRQQYYLHLWLARKARSHQQHNANCTHFHTAPQVAFADKILLNKTDLVSEAELKAVRARLRAINKTVEVIPTTRSAVDLDRILGIRAFNLDK